METLANAAYMSSPDQTYSSAFGHSDLHSMAVMGMGARHGGLGAGCMSQCMPPNVMAAAMPGMPSMGSHGLMPAQHLHGPGRHLQILDHTVHRIDAQRKPNGEQDNEMVVSNLRHFTLKVGVLDPHQGIGREADLPLKAELLYENGQPVEQLATCEPLLVGKTEVTAMQGSAMFKLRITSLSSHRDKQRFRIRVSPQDMGLLVREPGLAVVTTPMKCVTKLTHRSSAGMKHESTEEADGEEAEGSADGGGEMKKRKRDDLEAQLEAQGLQIESLQQTSSELLEKLTDLKQLLSQALVGVESRKSQNAQLGGCAEGESR